MAGTLKTAFYKLAKYAANDITSWLTDFNGNMDKIDTALNQNKTAAQAAQDGVDNLKAEYESLLSLVNGHTKSIEVNEKAIAANRDEIENLKDEFIIPISETFTVKSPVTYGYSCLVTKISTDAFVNTAGRGELSAGTTINCIAMGSSYLVPIMRVEGNPFALTNSVLAGMCEVITNNETTYQRLYLFYNGGTNETILGFSQSGPTYSVENTTSFLIM